MAKKIRRIYRDGKPVELITVGNKEPFKVCVGNKEVYSKYEQCTVTINYGDKTITGYKFKGQTIDTIIESLSNKDINEAVTGKYLVSWYVTNNGQMTELSPDETSMAKEILMSIIVNGDILITGNYNTSKYELTVYDYDKETVLDTIQVNYNTTIGDALADFDFSTLGKPNINLNQYNFAFNGLTEDITNDTIQDPNILEKPITEPLNIYPVYSLSERSYNITLNKYNYDEGFYKELLSVSAKYTNSIRDVLSDDQNSTLNSITEENYEGVTLINYIEQLFYTTTTTDYINLDTTLASFNPIYLKTNINLYIGYDIVVKTYSVKLYDELSGTYLYQNTEVIHNSILETLETLSGLLTEVNGNEYKSTYEEEHYTYNYWLEYADGTAYDNAAHTPVTSNITLHIKYNKSPNPYTITFIKDITIEHLDGTKTNRQEEVTYINTNYMSDFYLPDSCALLLKNTTVQKEASYQIETSYSDAWVSTIDANRMFTSKDNQTCIGNETFVIKCNEKYKYYSVNISIYDNGIIYLNETSKLISSGTISSISGMITLIKNAIALTSNEYIEDNLYYYNKAKTITLKCTTTDDIVNYTASVSDINSNNYTNLPNDIRNTSQIEVNITEGTKQAAHVTVTWVNDRTTETIKTASVHKGSRYIDLPYPIAPTMPGYSFDKWSDRQTDTTRIISNRTIYAYYTVSPSTTVPTDPGVYIRDSSGEYIKIMNITGTYAASISPISTTVNVAGLNTSSVTGYPTTTFTIMLIAPNGYNKPSSVPRMFLSVNPYYVEYTSSDYYDMPAGYYDKLSTELITKYNTQGANTETAITCQVWATDKNPSVNESWSNYLHIRVGIYNGSYQYSSSTTDYVSIVYTFKQSVGGGD